MNPATTTRLFFWTALISSWFTFVVYFTAIPGIIFWMIVLVALLIRKSKLIWFLIAFSSWTFIPLFSFTFGTKDYMTGSATFRYVGLPGPEFYNLDPVYRAWNSSSGCVVFGFEPLLNWPNNMAIRLWTTALGFQRDVYAGFYPDKIATENLLREKGKGTTVSRSGDSLIFKIGGQATVIKDEVGYNDSGHALAAARVVVDHELIVLKTMQDDDKEITYLADSKTKVVFAKYYVRGEDSERTPAESSFDL